MRCSDCNLSQVGTQKRRWLIYTERQKIYRNLCRPAVGLPGMEPKGCRTFCGGPLPHHEHRGDQGAAGCGSGRTGLRPFPLDHLPHAARGLGRYAGMGLYIQNRRLCLDQAKPQIRYPLYRHGLLDTGQCGNLPAGDPRAPQASGERCTASDGIPYRGTQQKASRGPAAD